LAVPHDKALEFRDNLAFPQLVIERLCKLWKVKSRRGEELGLAEDEIAFYNVLEINDSVMKVHTSPLE